LGLRVNWNPFEYSWGLTCCNLDLLYSDGSEIETLSTPGQNAIVYDTITRIDIGITKAWNCPSATVYLDNVNVYSYEWE